MLNKLVDKDKVDFLIGCGYDISTIKRCSVEVQEDMYVYSYRQKYKISPPKGRIRDYSDYPEEVYDLAKKQGITLEEAYKDIKAREDDQRDVLEASRGQY